MNDYIHGHGHAKHVHAARSASDSAAFLLPHLRPDMRLLDVGCGPGTITADLATHVAHATGVDAAPQQPPSGVEFIQSDAESLPFEDNTFDVAFAAQALHHVPNPVSALQEMQRVVKPGGIIASREVDYGAMTWYPANQGISRWRAIFSVIAALSDMEPNAGRHLPTWFTHAGLTDLQVSSSTWTYASTEERETLATSWITRTQEDNYRQRASEALNEDPTEAINSIVEGWNAWKDTPGALFLMPHVEVIATV